MICSQELMDKPFASYDELMENLFACVNTGLDEYLAGMKLTFATGQGGYKNVLYPDLEVAHDICRDKMRAFSAKEEAAASENGETEEAEEEIEEGEDDDLMSLLSGFAEKPAVEASTEENVKQEASKTLPEIMEYIMSRAEASVDAGVRMPFYELCKKQQFEPFTVFCFAAAVLSSTQTDYAGVFQVINENGSLSAPTIESAAKLFYGKEFSITGVYADMSVCLEQLLPVFDLRVMPSMLQRSE